MTTVRRTWRGTSWRKPCSIAGTCSGRCSCDAGAEGEVARPRPRADRLQVPVARRLPATVADSAAIRARVEDVALRGAERHAPHALRVQRTDQVRHCEQFVSRVMRPSGRRPASSWTYGPPAKPLVRKNVSTGTLLRRTIVPQRDTPGARKRADGLGQEGRRDAPAFRVRVDADGEDPAARLRAEFEGADFGEQITREAPRRFGGEADALAPGRRREELARTAGPVRALSAGRCEARRCARPRRDRSRRERPDARLPRAGSPQAFIARAPSPGSLRSAPPPTPRPRRAAAAAAGSRPRGTPCSPSWNARKPARPSVIMLSAEPGAVALLVAIPVLELVLAHALDGLRQAAGHRHARA